LGVEFDVEVIEVEGFKEFLGRLVIIGVFPRFVLEEEIDLFIGNFE